MSEPNSTNTPETDPSLASAFQGVHKTIAEREATEHKANVEELHAAIANKDKDTVERILDSLKRDALWLYEELMQHPQIGIKMRELSIFGL